MRLIFASLLALFLSGCAPDIVPGAGPTDNLPVGDTTDDVPDDDTGTPPVVQTDEDGDGWSVSEGDCDDTDGSVNPDATEVCNSVDDDCDGETDEDDAADAPTWYTDGDSDGYGDPSSSSVSCAAPAGSVSDDSDCDDTNAAVNPSATEVCNDVDDDCSGGPDDVDGNIWYLDADADGYGDPNIGVLNGCDLETTGGAVWLGDCTDCDDSDAAVNPGATEVCNSVDDDCDGETDEDDAADAATWYEDLDDDGQGSDVTQTACEAPDGFVGSTGDCVDTDPRTFTGATEVCDGVDNDCDLEIDEADGNPGVLELWIDADSDGWGDDVTGSSTTCPAEGLVEQDGDCDDTDGSVNPDATEICNSVDDDCDGETDEDDAADAPTWYTDGDSDGYGDGSSSTTSCSAPSGTVSDGTDCDDANASANPGAAEVCDSADNDCDGNVDVSAVDATTWYPDSDGDSFGNAGGTTVTQCDQPSSYVSDATDCNDGDSASYPGATEVCDGADNNCDGSIDPDSSSDAPTWYDDTDSDGYGDASSSSVSCSAPSGTVADASDCDDTDEFVNPDMLEVCGDTADNDCDGDTDSSPSCVTEGAYTGTFAIELTETTYGLGSDSCEGTASLTVDTTADPMISGTVECEFVGDAATYFPDTYSGTVEGDFDTDLMPSGSIDFSSFSWSFDWTDDGSGDTNVDGVFSGSDTYLGFEFDYTGDFATDYTP